MPEKIKSESTDPAVLPGEKVTIPAESSPAVRTEVAEPNEAFFGTLLIGCLALSLLAAAGYFAFSGYRYFKSMQAEEAIPSIAQLPATETGQPAVAKPAEEQKTAETAPVVKTETVDKKTIEMKVLNGGAAKGVAGTYTEKLKKEGFTKATVGNTFGNYTGTIIYYAKGQEAGLALLKDVVLKDYPNLTTKEAESGNKDTTAAPIVLILGR